MNNFEKAQIIIANLETEIIELKKQIFQLRQSALQVESNESVRIMQMKKEASIAMQNFTANLKKENTNGTKT